MNSLFPHLRRRLGPIQTSFFKLRFYSTHSDQDPRVQNLLSLLRLHSKSLSSVKSIHANIITTHLANHQYLASILVAAYSDVAALSVAGSVYSQFSKPKTILSNSLIHGYLRNDQHREALALFRTITDIDTYTCHFGLKACIGLSDYEAGFEIVELVVARGLDKHKFLGSTVMSFFIRFGKTSDARTVFDRMLDRDAVCWNLMIGGYVQASRFHEAFDVFDQMRFCSKVTPSPITMVSLIKACMRSGDVELGKCVHGYILVGVGMMRDDIMVLTSLIDMYCNMGEIVSARRVFETMPVRNSVCWNAMISGCVQSGVVMDSVALANQLLETGGEFDSRTIVSLVRGCSQTTDLKNGKILHGCVFRRGFESNVVVSTAIIDLYAKCGALNMASFVFRRMKKRNVVTWTAMLVGLAQNGRANEALNMFCEMQNDGIVANSVTLVSLLHSCSQLGCLRKGSAFHAHLIRREFSSDVVHRTVLIEMYARCGKINYAESIFFEESSVRRDIVLWNSMITAYGIHGHGERAMSVYKGMIEEGLKPNEVSFLSLIAACSHSGLVEEGIKLFQTMERDPNIELSEKHYASIVDMLSRAGRFEEAESLVKRMPFEAGTSVLEALLNGCRTHKNVALGVKIADRLLCLDSQNPGIYVILSNIYAQAKKWDAVNHVRNLMRTSGLKKTPGFSSIEVDSLVHTFFAGDDLHPKWAEIHEYLENLRLEVEASGYVADTSVVLRNVDEPMKVKLVWGHSERLAIAFGLLSTPAGTPIRITKNLRVCVDCHTVTKLISKIVQRDLIVRDVNRFHHFSNGNCSCNDYW